MGVGVEAHVPTLLILIVNLDKDAVVVFISRRPIFHCFRHLSSAHMAFKIIIRIRSDQRQTKHPLHSLQTNILFPIENEGFPSRANQLVVILCSSVGNLFYGGGGTFRALVNLGVLEELLLLALRNIWADEPEYRGRKAPT